MWRLILLLFLPALSAAYVSEHILVRQCISQGGSIYDLEFDLKQNRGEVRYRWLGQDIFYELRSVSRKGSTITAVAEFLESRSGETKGNPWNFSYHMGKNTISDSGKEHTCK